MPGYSEQELERARAPLRTEADRDDAFCILGHLLTEQRETYTADREATIKAITAVVQAFDTRSALGGSSAASFAGTGGLQPVAHAPRPPAPSPSLTIQPAPTVKASSGANLAVASMERELRRQGLTPAASTLAQIDMLSASGSAGEPESAATSSMRRELRRAGLARG